MANQDIEPQWSSNRVDFGPYTFKIPMKWIGKAEAIPQPQVHYTWVVLMELSPWLCKFAPSNFRPTPHHWLHAGG